MMVKLMIRSTLYAFALIVAGCAGQPPSSSAPTAAPAVALTPAGALIPVAESTTASGQNSDAKFVLEAKRLGYTVVDENGEQLFCHKNARTGSHLATEVTCLTHKQMDDLREQTQRRMQTFQMQMPPPQGK